jgi:hypothetical protein
MQLACSLLSRLATTAAHRSCPREHGRQAARCERDRARRTSKVDDELSTPAPAQPAP